MLIIREDRVSVAREYIEPLLEAHYRESANTAVYTLLPDYAKYEQIEQLGNLVTLLAMTEDMECVGYSVSFLTPHVHYMEQRIAYNDVIFVSKPYRDGTTGGRLMVRTRQEAKKEGCVLVQYHAKPNTTLDATLRKRLKVFETVYQDFC